MAVGGWRLGTIGSWRLVVLWGCPSALSLGELTKKNGVLKDAPPYPTECPSLPVPVLGMPGFGFLLLPLSVTPHCPDGSPVDVLRPRSRYRHKHTDRTLRPCEWWGLHGDSVRPRVLTDGILKGLATGRLAFSVEEAQQVLLGGVRREGDLTMAETAAVRPCSGGGGGGR